MKLMMIKILMLISTLISTLKTPMSMGMLLLIQTMISTFILSKLLTSSWMPMIIFLMFIGGLLILFMYMSSIASNEKFTPNLKIIIMILLVFAPLEELLLENQMNESQNAFLLTESITLSKIYNKKTMMITIMLFLYMFLSMIMVTKIIKVHKGPLRSKY